jgi:glycine cleavage system H lipoate-binding protein
MIRRIHHIISNKSMMRSYSNVHQWVTSSREDPNIFKLGYSKKTINDLGRVTYINFDSQKGEIIRKDAEISSIESIKMTGQLNAPFECKLVKNNEELAYVDKLWEILENPECESNSWIVEIEKL